MDLIFAGDRDTWHKLSRSQKPLKIVKNAEHRIYKSNNCRITYLSIKDEIGAKKMEKRIGDYYSIETQSMTSLDKGIAAGESLAEILSTILAQFQQKRLCICGLGNPDCVCDSLGPATIKTFPAYTLETYEPKMKCNFSKLVTVVPNVFGATNLATAEIVAGLASAAKADCVILVDSIVTEDSSCFCNNIQVTTSGGPVSHFGGKDEWEVVGVPIIFIGIPTAILLSGQTIKEMLTVSNVQDVILNGATVLAYALMRASYPDLAKGLCKKLLLPSAALPLLW